MSISDLSGKIVFKVKLDKEIKKIVIHNDDINYNELLLMMQRIFSDKIKPNDDILMKYTDEENDLITLSNDSDVLLALQSSKILKLTLFLKDKEENLEEQIKPNEIVKELYNIRVSIDSFLEKFERSLKISDARNHLKLEDSTKSLGDSKLATSNASHLIKSELHKEFDPLGVKKENNLAKNFRSQTPDSITSIESSPSQSKFNFNSNGVSTHQPQVHSQHANSLNQEQLHQQQQQFQQFNQMASNQPQMQQQQPQQQQQQQPHQLPPQQQQQQQQQFYPNPAQLPNPAANPLSAPNPSQFQMNQNPALSKPPQQLNPIHQQGVAQTPPQQPFGFQNQPTDPQAQAYFNQQQQQLPQGPMPGLGMGVPGGFQQQPGGMNAGNPYSKAPNQSLARPPSTTIYQQGYK